MTDGEDAMVSVFLGAFISAFLSIGIGFLCGTGWGFLLFPVITIAFACLVREKRPLPPDVNGVTDLVAAFRAVNAELSKMKKKEFPRGTVVKLTTGQICIAVSDSEPGDMLACLYESGSTWWPPLENASIHTGQMPTWVTEKLLLMKVK